MLEIFVSHSSKDLPVVKLLVDLLRTAFSMDPSAIRCTSLDGYRLPVGADTDMQLRTEILNSKAFIALLSQESLKSTYVLFEMGARWGAEKHLAPLLAPGTSPDIIEGPLKGLNSLNCESLSQLHQLVSNLSDVLGRKPSAPESIIPIIQSLASFRQSSSRQGYPPQENQNAPVPMLNEDMQSVLMAIEEIGEDPNRHRGLGTLDHPLTAARIAEKCGLSRTECRDVLNSLVDIGFVESHYPAALGAHTFTLASPKGVRWVADRRREQRRGV